MLVMNKVQISKGGQISIPASIRRRWQSRDVVIEDRGDEIVVRPLPSDPIAAARGSLRSPHSAEANRRALRSEEASRKR